MKEDCSKRKGFLEAYSVLVPQQLKVSELITKKKKSVRFQVDASNWTSKNPETKEEEEENSRAKHS